MTKINNLLHNVFDQIVIEVIMQSVIDSLRTVIDFGR